MIVNLFLKKLLLLLVLLVFVNNVNVNFARDWIKYILENVSKAYEKKAHFISIEYVKKYA